jgi:hypothetical protein
MTYNPTTGTGIPRVEVFASSNAGQVVTANTEPVQYEDEVTDTHNAWSVDTFTCPVPGLYVITATVDPTSGAGAASIHVRVNDVQIGQGAAAPAGGLTMAVVFAGWLSGGDIVTVRCSATITRDTSDVSNTIHILLTAQAAP